MFYYLKLLRRWWKWWISIRRHNTYVIFANFYERLPKYVKEPLYFMLRVKWEIEWKIIHHLHEPTWGTMSIEQLPVTYNAIKTFMIKKRRQRHKWHVLPASPWPILTALNAFYFLWSLVAYLHYMPGAYISLMLAFLLLILTLTSWFRDIIREATYMGFHTLQVQRNLRFGFVLFILSEVMFFLSFFWAYFHCSLSPSIHIGAIWPPEGIVHFFMTSQYTWLNQDDFFNCLNNLQKLIFIKPEMSNNFFIFIDNPEWSYINFFYEYEKKFMTEYFLHINQESLKNFFTYFNLYDSGVLMNPYKIPFLNTIILLTSGAILTTSHMFLRIQRYYQSIIALIFTICLAFYFIYCQFFEYIHANFSINDGIYGSTFFMLTGFHGFHVIIGTIFLSICLCRFFGKHYRSTDHLSYECAIWYWHFVDVVWILLYLVVYLWPSIYFFKFSSIFNFNNYQIFNINLKFLEFWNKIFFENLYVNNLANELFLNKLTSHNLNLIINPEYIKVNNIIEKFMASNLFLIDFNYNTLISVVGKYINNFTVFFTLSYCMIILPIIKELKLIIFVLSIIIPSIHIIFKIIFLFLISLIAAVYYHIHEWRFGWRRRILKFRYFSLWHAFKWRWNFEIGEFAKIFKKLYNEFLKSDYYKITLLSNYNKIFNNKFFNYFDTMYLNISNLWKNIIIFFKPYIEKVRAPIMWFIIYSINDFVVETDFIISMYKYSGPFKIWYITKFLHFICYKIYLYHDRDHDFVVIDSIDDILIVMAHIDLVDFKKNYNFFFTDLENLKKKS